MSGPVSWFVSSVDGYLDAAGETVFGGVAGAIGDLVIAMATFAVILVALNAMLQVRAVDLRTSVILAVKIALVGIFALNYAQFNSVTNAIIGGSEAFAGAMVGAAGGVSDGSAAGLAREFDEIILALADVGNRISSSMQWVGGALFNLMIYGFLGVLGSLVGLMLVFAKLMITFYVAIAPIMIALSLLNATKDYFQNWLTGIVSYAFYPIIIAAVFSVIIGVNNAMIASMGSGTASLGETLPFIITVIMAIIGVFLIPVIMRQVTGNIQLTSVMSGPMAALSVMSAARMAGFRMPGQNQGPTGGGSGGATQTQSPTSPRPSGGTGAGAAASARAARSARLAR